MGVVILKFLKMGTLLSIGYIFYEFNFKNSANCFAQQIKVNFLVWGPIP